MASEQSLIFFECAVSWCAKVRSSNDKKFQKYIVWSVSGIN